MEYRSRLNYQPPHIENNNMTRVFKSGATRNPDNNKLDYEAFNSPVVDWYYAQYMHKHRFLEDGTMRDGDNWQKGFPLDVINKSLARHYKDYHLASRGYEVLENGDPVDIKDILCGIIFNCKAYLHEVLKDKKQIERNYEDNRGKQTSRKTRKDVQHKTTDDI